MYYSTTSRNLPYPLNMMEDSQPLVSKFDLCTETWVLTDNHLMPQNTGLLKDLCTLDNVNVTGVTGKSFVKNVNSDFLNAAFLKCRLEDEVG